MGTRQQESKYKREVGKNQIPVSSKKSTPPPGFSKFRFSYCILPTAICLLVSVSALESWGDKLNGFVAKLKSGLYLMAGYKMIRPLGFQ